MHLLFNSSLLNFSEVSINSLSYVTNASVVWIGKYSLWISFKSSGVIVYF